MHTLLISEFTVFLVCKTEIRPLYLGWGPADFTLAELISVFTIFNHDVLINILGDNCMVFEYLVTSVVDLGHKLYFWRYDSKASKL